MWYHSFYDIIDTMISHDYDIIVIWYHIWYQKLWTIKLNHIWYHRVPRFQMWVGTQAQTRNPGLYRMLTRMSYDGTSHGTVTSSHDRNVDESRLSRTRLGRGWVTAGFAAGTSRALVLVPQQQANPLRTGSACWVPLLARNPMWDPEQRRRALESETCCAHRSGTSCAHIYRPGAQGRSKMGNNVKIWLLLPILTCYCFYLL